MKIKDFNKLAKEYEPKKIISMFTKNEINLSDKQLDIIIDLKNRKKVNYGKRN